MTFRRDDLGGNTDGAAGRRKVIITCAVTGAPQAPSMAARPPTTVREIAEQAVESARAGAAILHLHARDHHLFDKLVPRIADETDAIISISTGGNPAPRLAGRLTVAPELCSVRMPSTSLPSSAEAETDEDVLGDVRATLARFADAPGTRFAFECQDVGDLEGLKRLVDEGLVQGPLFLQYGLGAGRGTRAESERLARLRAAADRLFGQENHAFSVFGAGRLQMSVVTMGAILGGHVRVGLEDGPSVSRGPLAMSCSAQVLKVRRILDELSLAIASPAEARDILKIRGAEKASLDG